MNRARRFLTALFLALVAVWGCVHAQTEAPAYVGGSACVSCHQEQHDAWMGSHHDLAMQLATSKTVLGDFDDAEIDHFGVITRFYRDGDRFMVNTDGPDGDMNDFRIAYTFGFHPLQQYLVEFPGGRLQALDIAWDTRPADEGGQRWFHLHPADPVRHDDVLHWTGPNLNWNYMCADCHSTNLRKNYDAGNDSYQTSWSDIDVACEACHGPGSAHIAWAQDDAEQASGNGLVALLGASDDAAWSRDADTGELKRSVPRESANEIQVCARCHARRGQLNDGFSAGSDFMDSYRPSLLTEGLYFADGQIEDEVYVWGSFLQSKMYRSGVTCTDCHDPHTTELRAENDPVCLRCHEGDRYASESHHFHSPESPGSECVACHMPTRTYMQVDARRDHGFRVPRPDQSVSLGTPNACNQCHADEAPEWAADKIVGWLGRPARDSQEYAQALSAGRLRLPGASGLLRSLAADPGQPEIARATALAALGGSPDRAGLELLQLAINTGGPLERLGAVAALEAMGPRERIIAAPLLWDEVRAVRTDAARLLAVFPPDRLPEQIREKLREAVTEYISIQKFNAERPEAQFNLAGIYSDLGRFEDAEQAYRTALRRQPKFVPAYVNFSQMLSSRNREQEAEGLLRAGLELNPDNADLAHALGLSLVRQQRPVEASDFLRLAALNAPENPRYTYVYAVGVYSGGEHEQALQLLEDAHRRHPGDTDVLYGLATFNRDAGNLEAAVRHARKLLELQPGNPALQQLLAELERQLSSTE